MKTKTLIITMCIFCAVIFKVDGQIRDLPLFHNKYNKIILVNKAISIGGVDIHYSISYDFKDLKLPKGMHLYVVIDSVLGSVNTWQDTLKKNDTLFDIRVFMFLGKRNSIAPFIWENTAFVKYTISIEGTVSDTSTSYNCNMYIDGQMSNTTSRGIWISTPDSCDYLDTKTISACTSYKSPSGKYTWTSSGIYNDTLRNAVGNDSIITLNVTINKIDTSVSIEGTTLLANLLNATYQWLDCNNNYNFLSGMINQSYTATASGSYAVKVTANGCSDTSSCCQVNTVGITIYPNPTSGMFLVDLGDNHKFIEATIMDISGKKIETNVQRKSRLLKMEINGLAGLYLLKLKTEYNVSLIKLIKY